MAKVPRKTKRYPSDLADEAWAQVEPLMDRSTANVSDNAGTRTILTTIGKRWRWLKHFIVDA